MTTPSAADRRAADRALMAAYRGDIHALATAIAQARAEGEQRLREAVRKRAIWLPTAEWPNCVQHYGGDVAIPHCHLCDGEWQPTCQETHLDDLCPAAQPASKERHA